MENYYKSLGIAKTKTKDRSKQFINNILKKPKDENKEDMPVYNNNYPMNHIHQADIVYLPFRSTIDEEGKEIHKIISTPYKYALVIVNVGYPRVVDAEPLKEVSSKQVLKAMKKIYKRNILSIPKILEVDAGIEFKGDTKDWLNSNKVIIKVAKTGRKRQLAIAERANQTIGNAVHFYLTSQEILIGSLQFEWVEILPVIIKEMNVRARSKPKPEKTKFILSGEDKEGIDKVIQEAKTISEMKGKKLDKYMSRKSYPDVAMPRCNKQSGSCNLLKEGTQVRVRQEVPRNIVDGKRLQGNFRGSDVRWSLTTRD